MCGSMVTVDICLNENKVVDYGHEVKACALGQAAAALYQNQLLGVMWIKYLLLVKN